MTRVLSHTEIQTALDCEAKHDFQYGDQLAGSSLRPKQIAPRLSEGRAWGAAVAAWHTNAGDADAGKLAIEAMDASLEKDADRLREHGLYDEDQHNAMRVHLLQMLVHHFTVVEHIPMDAVTERSVLVSIPSRNGNGRASSRYKFLGFLDATETAEDGDLWINEFKIRDTLSDVGLIVNDRQIRRYAWAVSEELGKRVKGVFVNERLNVAPKLPRMVKTGRKDGTLRPSHAKDQLCTADAYVANCGEHGEDPDPDTEAALRARRWFQRVPVLFRPGELAEAGRELVSAAQLIRDLDLGHRYPIRNVKRQNCSWCTFKDICPAPDNDLVEVLFERTPAKRNKPAQNSQGGLGATSEGAAT